MTIHPAITMLFYDTGDTITVSYDEINYFPLPANQRVWACFMKEMTTVILC